MFCFGVYLHLPFVERASSVLERARVLVPGFEIFGKRANGRIIPRRPFAEKKRPSLQGRRRPSVHLQQLISRSTSAGTKRSVADIRDSAQVCGRAKAVLGVRVPGFAPAGHRRRSHYLLVNTN